MGLSRNGEPYMVFPPKKCQGSTAGGVSLGMSSIRPFGPPGVPAFRLSLGHVHSSTTDPGGCAGELRCGGLRDFRAQGEGGTNLGSGWMFVSWLNREFGIKTYPLVI